MTAQIGARRTLKLTPEGFHGTKRPHSPHGRVRRRSPSSRRLRARRAPSGGLGASRGEGYETTLRLRKVYAETLYKADGATRDDLREAVTTLEDAGRIAQRVFGGAHPTTMKIEEGLREARAALRARETPPQA